MLSSNLHLPTVSKGSRRHFQRTPNSYTNPMASETVSALKAKYTDYAMWLKASSRQNREPIFTHELLKHSLCQMGIDSTQAEQLVSTCSWYVYQFQRELEEENEQMKQSMIDESKKSNQLSKKRTKKVRRIKSKKPVLIRENSAESATTIASTNKGSILLLSPQFSRISSLENSISSGQSSPIRNRFSVLPTIPSTDPSLSPRSRRVDFDHEQSYSKPKSHWRTAVPKTRVLPKLRTDSSVINDDRTSPESAITDYDLSNSQKSLPRAPAVHTRSILRKQISQRSSITSETNTRKTRSRIVSPNSTIIDEIPLGTKSQRLFGGSECFAEILNELEEQKLY